MQQKLGLNLSLQQKLSPQQIQFIKLLEVPTAELESRIEEELEDNPALEAEKDEDEYAESDNYEEESQEEPVDDLSLENYIDEEDRGYKMQGDGPDPDEDDKETPLSDETSLVDSLLIQIGFLQLNERQQTIAQQIVGSIDTEGYLRRDIKSIVNDLAFTQNVMTDVDEVESILYKVQELDPPGIAARNLQECLLLQLKRLENHVPEREIAKRIIEDHFNEFSKKHYEKIKNKLDINDEQLKNAYDIIIKCNPKPGSGAGSSGTPKSQYIIPDFILTNNNGSLEIILNAKNAPELRVSPSYQEMFKAYEQSQKKDKKMKEAVSFVKQKLDAAKWFIEAIQQRQNTLLRTMQAIVNRQYEYFLEGDEAKLKPMILKDIADDINMDISTVSRVVSSKTVQTEFGIFPLKYFFSEGITKDSGEDVSSREVKNQLKAIIDNEDKKKPYADEALVKFLKEKGYPIARRTVAKYREQMDIPVARLRKEI